ncbi:hypothetical protein K469DRAFT_699027 [Zopfia rhizophila CBS 207.26]|uniref:DUF7600 domain-containing protein n=1 Tax=Zopfia rhizophila CBS 207.26 TaxID=1314779 RepID=A0A6A6EZ69_9PEZI|nr:hypothetical protein K469DRAFT_699027 [Zopfia rhizophila CBS 207.26]
MATYWQPGLFPEDTSRWNCGHGELMDSETVPFHFGCRSLFKRKVALQPLVVTVKVSLLLFHGTTYITGFRFYFADGTTNTIGYILEDREVPLDTECGLRGFEVAVRERGIHALRIIKGNDTFSPMAGKELDFNIHCLATGGCYDCKGLF